MPALESVSFSSMMASGAAGPVRAVFVAGAMLTGLGVSSAGLVGHYSFDDPGAVGRDSGSFAIDGTLSGQAQFSGDARIGGGALLLDGNDDYVSIGGASEFSGLDDNGSGFTLAVWVNPSSLSGVRRVFSTGMFGGFTAEGWGCGFSGASPFATTYGVRDFNADIDVLNVGTWTHLAYVYRPVAGEIRFYVGGSLVATKSGSAGMRDTTTGFVIGGIALPGNGQWFSGRLDELRIYDTELGDSEIAALADTTTVSIENLNANPAPLAVAGSSTLSWSVHGAESVTLDGGGFTNLDVTGQSSIVASGIASTTTFTLTASTGETVTSREVVVAVDPSPVPPRINEFLASNLSGLTDEDGDLSDWIEVHNPNPYDFNLEGWHLTDDELDLTQWSFPDLTVPPGGYVLVFASNKDRDVSGAELHASFRLSVAGEYLALVNPAGLVVQEFAPGFPPQLTDYSYGIDGGSGAFFLPTPGTANGPPLTDLPPTITEVTEDPAQPGEAADLGITARVAATGGGLAEVTLHYRIGFGSEQAIVMADDGNRGDGVAGDGVFGGLIPAAAYDAGDMVRWYVTAASTGGSTVREPRFADPQESAEYFGTVVSDPTITSPLPALHWFVDDEAASETRTGTQASLFFNGRFYDNVYCRTRGQSAGSWPKHKFKFDFYPGGHFKWSESEPRVEEFNLQSFYREMFTQSSNTSYMREPMMFGWMNAAGAAAPETMHLHVRRNGAFYGLFAFIEQVDDTFLSRRGYEIGPMYKAAWQGGGPATLSPDPRSGQYRKVLMESEPWTDFTAFCNGINISNPGRFTYVRDHVDVAQWINVMAAMNVPFNHDQLTKNYYVYLDPQTAEWHRFPWDADQSFPIGQYITGENWTNPLYGDASHTQELSGGGPNPAWQNHMHAAILDDPVTRQMYMRRVKNLADRYLATTHFEDIVAANLALLESDADADRTYWASRGVSLSGIEAGVNEILSTALPRRRTHLFSTYAQGGAIPLLPDPEPSNPVINIGTIDYNPIGGNQDEEYFELLNPNAFAVDLSGWTVEGAVTHTFQAGVVIPSNGTLHVSPDVIAFRGRETSPRGGEGHFVQGNYAGHFSNFGETLVLKDSSGTVVASKSYTGIPSDPQLHLVVSELMSVPADGHPDAEFLELTNISDSVTLDLGGVQFTDGILFTFPDGFALLPGERTLLVYDEAAFASAYGAGFNIAGSYAPARLDNAGELIKLEDATHSTIKEFAYDDVFPWPVVAAGYSLVLVAPSSNPDPSVPSNWRCSVAAGGTPGGTDSNPLAADPDGDDDADGVNNLLHHALTGPNPVVLPILVVDSSGGVAFRHSRNLAADDVRFSLEESVNLVDWFPSDATPGSETHNGDGTTTVTWTIPPPVSPASRGFFRLRVTLGP